MTGNGGEAPPCGGTTRRPRGILASCQLPWDGHGRLLVDAFADEVDFLVGLGFTELYVFGTAGEGYAIDTPTYRRVVELFRDLTAARSLVPMVGVIGMSTAAVVERVAISRDLGVRRFQVSLPPWSPPSDREVLAFFEGVCGAFPDSEFLHYNAVHAKRILTGAEYRRVADAVPNLVATKNVAGGSARATDLMWHAPDLQHFFGEDNYLHGAMFGECSLLTTFGAVAPELTHDYFAAGIERNAARLLAAHHEFAVLRQRIVAPLAGRGLVDGAYDKLLLRLGGLASMAPSMLPPYEGFTDEECAAVARELEGVLP